MRCTLPDDNAAATCLVVVHKKLLHLDSGGLRTIIASHTFKRSRNSNIVSGFVKDLSMNVKDYHVGVVEVTLKKTMEPNGNVALCVCTKFYVCHASISLLVHSEKRYYI